MPIMEGISIFSLAARRAREWAENEKNNSRSAAGAVLRHIDSAGKMRLPQREAIEARLWLKFVGGNETLAKAVMSGIFIGEDTPPGCDRIRSGYPEAQKFFIALANSHKAKKLEDLACGFSRSDGDWEADLKKMLGGYDYPNRVHSLPMGAGKTYLMAAFIYLDLHFSRLLPGDSRFARNFVVLAPHAAKTAILPSLKTIGEFDPEWVLPKNAAAEARGEIQVEVLDAPKANPKSTGVNNPNLEKVNRLLQSRGGESARGLVFITNAEKVVLERLDEYVEVKMGGRKEEEARKHNELRDCMAKIPALSVFLDEAHHTYSRDESEEKKLRKAVAVLADGGNLREVEGFSGTPLGKTQMDIGGCTIRPKYLQDVLYHFPLANSIGRFLKTPKVVGYENVREEAFVSNALDEFFGGYDIEYQSGAKSKIAFYCPTVAALNEEVLPAVKKWLEKNRPGCDDEVLCYYTKNKDYPLPKDALASFHSLDSPSSRKRIVLLVAVGREGWDCRSLTAVALPRRPTSKELVLQTSCRCLREVDNAEKEKALIVLGEGNMKILADELRAVHDISIDEFQRGIRGVDARVLKRKHPLGRLQFKQVKVRWILESGKAEEPPSARLQKFSVADFVKSHPSVGVKRGGRIGEGGRITRQTTAAADGNLMQTPLAETYWNFLLDVERACFGLRTAAGLGREFGDELSRIYRDFDSERKWFANHHNGNICAEFVGAAAACLAEARMHRREESLENADIQLLEWRTDAPTVRVKGGNILPEGVDYYHPPATMDKLMDVLIDDCDTHDISFNYAPYSFDSGYEKKALLELLKEEALSGLELYYNGMRHADLSAFAIQTGRGRYTPDFLLLKRKGGAAWREGEPVAPVAKVLIIETKGGIYDNADFHAKEKFVRDAFLRHNPNFRYHCLRQEEDFDVQLAQLREEVAGWMGNDQGERQ